MNAIDPTIHIEDGGQWRAPDVSVMEEAWIDRLLRGEGGPLVATAIRCMFGDRETARNAVRRENLARLLTDESGTR